MRLVDGAAGECGDEGVVADLLAEAGDHGGDLGVEQRARHVAEAEHENLDVLAGGVEDLHHRLVGEEVPQRGEVDVGGLGVDHRNLLGTGELHHAELRPVGALTHELGVDGDELLRGEAVAESAQGVRGRDQAGRRESGAGRTGHLVVVHGGWPKRQRGGGAGDRRNAGQREDLAGSWRALSLPVAPAKRGEGHSGRGTEGMVGARAGSATSGQDQPFDH